MLVHLHCGTLSAYVTAKICWMVSVAFLLYFSLSLVYLCVALPCGHQCSQCAQSLYQSCPIQEALLPNYHSLYVLGHCMFSYSYKFWNCIHILKKVCLHTKSAWFLCVLLSHYCYCILLLILSSIFQTPCILLFLHSMQSASFSTLRSRKEKR